MPRTGQRIARTLGLVALVLATSACAAPATNASPSTNGSSHPAPTQTATEASHEFVSKQYHFRLALPKKWSGVDAQNAWDGRALQGQGSPAFADFTESGSESVFTIGAAPVAAGTQLAAWRAAMVRAAPSRCVDSRSATAAMLGGEPALTWTADCGDVHPVKFAVVHGARGYIAIFEGTGSSVSAAEQRVFDAIVRSFGFTD